MSKPLSPTDRVIVVGAGLSGWRLCEGLRREGFAGEILLIGDEAHPPYDRPPLSKQVLTGKWSIDQAALATNELVSSLDITLRLADSAVALDVESRAVTLASGDVLSGTHVALATGSRARRLSTTVGESVLVVRSLDDAAQLAARADAQSSGDVVGVIGGGFIGAEIATSLATRGLRPIVVEGLSYPLLNVLGAGIAERLAELPERGGVELRVNQNVRDVRAVDGDLEIQFAEGSALRCSLVVAGVGAAPNVEWLESSGLALSDGVITDEFLTAAPGVSAIGDIAHFRWLHGPFDESVRIEHWQVAIDHAGYLARQLMSSAPERFAVTPYFWSDQYGKKIQILGRPHRDDDVEIVLEGDDGRFLALYSREGYVSALCALSLPRALMMSKSLVDDHVTVVDALRTAPWRS